jgi:GNAT superfamily N-acetyltransferase
MTSSQSITIEAFDERHRAEIERIFFDSSATQRFASEDVKAQFRARWLDRYLDHRPSAAAVAIAEGAGVVGYVVGSLSDIARDRLFADIGYVGIIAADTSRFPGHLHVNVADGWRGLRIGERLVARFADHAQSRGVQGFHIVTSAAARNVGFYRRIGLEDVRTFEWNGGRLLMMGRRLDPST